MSMVCASMVSRNGRRPVSANPRNLRGNRKIVAQDIEALEDTLVLRNEGFVRPEAERLDDRFGQADHGRIADRTAAAQEHLRPMRDNLLQDRHRVGFGPDEVDRQPVHGTTFEPSLGRTGGHRLRQLVLAPRRGADGQRQAQARHRVLPVGMPSTCKGPGVEAYSARVTSNGQIVRFAVVRKRQATRPRCSRCVASR